MKKFWEAKAAADGVGEVYIYGSIVSYKWSEEDVTANSFKKELEDLGDINTLNIYINSPGGSVFQAQAIFTILKRHTATKNVYIDGIAASAASFLAMAGDAVYIPKNATMMVHNPMTYAYGNAKDMRQAAEMLDKVREGMIEAYMSHVKITEDKLKELLDAETWLTAKEAVEYGFADELIEEKNVAACIDPEIMATFKNVPEQLQQSGIDPHQKERELLAKEAKEINEKYQKILGGI